MTVPQTLPTRPFVMFIVSSYYVYAFWPSGSETKPPFYIALIKLQSDLLRVIQLTFVVTPLSRRLHT